MEQKVVSLARCENCCLLGCYTASSYNSLPTFQDNLSVLSSKVKNPKRTQKSVVLIYFLGGSLKSSIDTFLCVINRVLKSCCSEHAYNRQQAYTSSALVQRHIMKIVHQIGMVPSSLIRLQTWSLDEEKTFQILYSMTGWRNYVMSLVSWTLVVSWAQQQ